MDGEVRFLRDYATQRLFLRELAGTDSHPASRAAERVLLETVEIAEGTTEPRDTFPQCAIVWNDGHKFASGIHLGGRIVLTASHVARSLRPTMVSIGVASIDERFGGDDFKVSSIVLPPVGSLVWDGAILVLETSGPSTNRTRLATAAEFATALHGRLVTVCGFGWGWPAGQPNLASPGIKRSMEVPISPDVGPDVDPANFFMAGDADPDPPFSNVCKLDSGAPAFIDDDGELLLLGIASRTRETEASLIHGCGSSPLAFFTRVDARRDWIVEKMSWT